MVSDYNYPDSKIIDAVVFRESAQGSHRAYLHAAKTADPAVLQKIASHMAEQGWQSIPFLLDDGQPALEVRGFRRDSQLLTLLAQNDWVEGKGVGKEDEKGKPGLWEKFKNRTLQASGLTYIIGDYGFFSYGRKSADKLVTAGAVSYFLGTLSLLFYGRNDQSDLQVHDYAKDIQKFLSEKKIDLSQEAALHKITEEKPKTLPQKANEFLKRYPSEVFNTVTALAGVFVGASAYKKFKAPPNAGHDTRAISEVRKVALLDMGLGGLTTASGVFGTVVQEKKHDADAPPAKGIRKIWEKIREHPLAVTGAGYTVSTLFHAISTVKDYKEARRIHDAERLASVPRRGLFVAMAFLSEFLLAISSKGHGEGVQTDNVNNSVVALSAELIAKQPKAEQDRLVDAMADYLGRSDKLALKDADLRAMLQAKVDAMCNNPWAGCKPEPQAQPEAVSAAPQPEIKSWTAKIDAAPTHQNALA